MQLNAPPLSERGAVEKPKKTEPPPLSSRPPHDEGAPAAHDPEGKRKKIAALKVTLHTR